jgi:HK97 family phage major capsid protein
LDALFKALTKIRSNAFFEPDAYVLNPLDWELLALAKDVNGQYYAGGPFLAAYAAAAYQPFPPLWGKPAVITTAIPQGTALAAAFKISGELYPRTGLTISMTNSDQDDFIKNLVTIRAEQRAAFGVVHPLGFCSVTGIA